MSKEKEQNVTKENEAVFRPGWNLSISKDDIPELLGEIIDVFEDFLSDKGVTKEMIPNPERDDYEEDLNEEEAECTALIFGDDYDLIADAVASILKIER